MNIDDLTPDVLAAMYSEAVAMGHLETAWLAAVALWGNGLARGMVPMDTYCWACDAGLDWIEQSLAKMRLCDMHYQMRI